MIKNNNFKKNISVYMMIVSIFFLTTQLYGVGSVSATYTGGDIPTGYNADCSTLESLQFTVPSGNQVIGIDVNYSMTAQSGGWKSDQKSQIRYVEGNTDEGTYTSGTGNSGGTQSYNRTGLTLANGATGVVTFEMKAQRTWQGSGTCNTTYNKVDTNTWTITVNYDKDTDGDGVLDGIDKDDDNDGILDTVESIVDLSIFELQGSATAISATEYQITPANNNQYGSAMSKHTVSMLQDFSIDAEIYLGTNNGGADGMTFVLHNDPRGSSAIGNGEGSTLGAMANGSTPGIANGLSFEFDTYQSSSGSDDPSSDHTQIRDTDFAFNDTNGRVTNVTTLSNLEDGNWHTFHLDWNAGTSTFSYLIDGVSMPGFTDANMAANYFGGSTQVYFGFTAATGGLNNVQRIRNVSSTVLKDTDGDGVFNSLDLDSDNDGIADTVEVQATNPFTLIVGGTAVDANGIPNEVSPQGFTPVDTDTDGIDDYLDKDTDNDQVSDCIEGIKDTVATSKSCPIDNTTVGINGLTSWAENSDDYTEVAGKITNPVSELIDFKTVTTNEVSYRESSPCGNELTWSLKINQWKSVSAPCAIADDIGTVFAALGTKCMTDSLTEACSWDMFKPKDFSGDRNTGYLRMAATDKMTAADGGYWIITDKDITIKINENDTASLPNGVSAHNKTAATNHVVSSSNFDEVSRGGGQIPSTSNVQKILIGNPFPGAFQVGDFFVTIDSQNSYYPLGHTSVASGVYNVLYIYDAVGTDTANYVAKSPTPGFGDIIEKGIGFWLGVKANSGASGVGFDIPYTKVK